jgi:predicted enzyme related to lactoylglutathione lyase
MIGKVTNITIMVDDQDDALRFYIEKLGFVKLQDVTLGNFRWLVVAPSGGGKSGIALMKAETPDEKTSIGRQTGGRTSLFAIMTDDIWQTYKMLSSKGVEFVGRPADNPWGIAVQFKDLYGNLFDLMQPRVCS